MQILCVMIMCQTLIAWNDAVLDAAGKPHVVMLLKAAVLIALLPSIWVGSEFGIEGVAIAFTLTTLIFGQIPSFVITIRQLSLSALTVLGRLRGIVPAAAATCIAVVLVRQALEDQGISIEPRVLLSVIAGAVVYALALRLFARERRARASRNGSQSPAGTAVQELTRFNDGRVPFPSSSQAVAQPSCAELSDDETPRHGVEQHATIAPDLLPEIPEYLNGPIAGGGTH